MRLLNVSLWFLTGLTLTGLALMLVYVPYAGAPVQETPARPHVTVGYILRGIHFWMAQGILLAVLGSLARTVAIKTRRRMTAPAAAFMVLVGLLWFTGILLPWDQLPLWMQSWWHGVDPQTALWTVYWTHTLALFLLTLPLLIAYVRRTRRDLSASL